MSSLKFPLRHNFSLYTKDNAQAFYEDQNSKSGKFYNHDWRPKFFSVALHNMMKPVIHKKKRKIIRAQYF